MFSGRRIVLIPSISKKPNENQKNGFTTQLYGHKLLYFVHESHELVESRSIFLYTPTLQLTCPIYLQLHLHPSCIACMRVFVCRLYLAMMLTCILQVHMTECRYLQLDICLLRFNPQGFLLGIQRLFTLIARILSCFNRRLLQLHQTMPPALAIC